MGEELTPASHIDVTSGPFETKDRESSSYGELIMGNLLHYAVVFLIVALVAAFLGFGGVAGTAMDGARILFWIAIVLFGVSLVAGLVRRA